VTGDPAPYFATPGDMIRHIRKSKRITIIELAERMGVSQAYITRLELGEIKLTQEQIEVIQTFLD
jgi:transcriptional regulator with XRE-family HTH domain